MVKTKRSGWASLLRDQRGGVAVMAALAMFPLTALTFAAVEFHRYVDVRSELQDALDAATLAVARSTETDPAALNAVGLAVLQASFNESEYVVSSHSFVDAEGNVTGAATVTIPPVVSSLFGVTQLSATASSKASRLGRKLEIALVLDNTYSMLTNNRIGLTKTAAAAFVDKLSEAAGQSRVTDALKISLVPYSTTVNVGAGYSTATWMDRNAVNPTHHEIFSTPTNRFTLFTQMNVPWAGCVESRPYPHDVNDTGPDPAQPGTYFVPYFAPDEHDEWTQAIFRISNNYLPDLSTSTDWLARQKNPAKYVSTPGPSSWSDSGYSAGPNYGCKLQPVVRLTTNVSAVKAGIAAMEVTGDTYTNIGLMWGWHSVSPNAPFADGVPYAQTVGPDGAPGPVQKIIVLMTDGENASYNNGSPNASIYSGGAYIPQGRFGITSGTATERRTALDARMIEVCTNVKAKGIVLYVIRVEVTGASVLPGCASGPDKYFDVTSADQLDGVFTKIADSLLNLRIAG